MFGYPVDLVQGEKDAELYLSVFHIDMEPYANITNKQSRQIKARAKYGEPLEGSV